MMKTEIIKKYLRKTIVYRKVKQGIISLLYIFPIDDKKIVFDNFEGKGFGDDPKYIAEELLQRNLDLKMIWVTRNVQINLPDKICAVKYGTIRAAYHWITAKVWVDNVKSTIRPAKRKGQYYIQTWHSTLGFKKNEQDAPKLPARYIKQAMKDGKQIDLMYSDNEFRCEKYRNSFWYYGEVIKCDVPRMEILLHDNCAVKNKVRDELKIEHEKRIVLYAPTFRKKTNNAIYKVDASSICQVLKERFGYQYEFIMRLHPNESDYAKEITQELGVIDATGYPDMQELLAAVDILITDYSGCMFDFGFARKPVFLLAKDVDEYLREEREWYFKLNDVPFDLAQSERELENNILKFDEHKYRILCDEFEKKIGFVDSGMGAKLLADRIIKQMKKESIC